MLAAIFSSLAKMTSAFCIFTAAKKIAEISKGMIHHHFDGAESFSITAFGIKALSIIG
jgi:hypothetical protein